MAALLFLRMVVEDHNNLFVAAETVHALGTFVLIYKLTKEKACAGTSSFFFLLIRFVLIIVELDRLGFFD